MSNSTCPACGGSRFKGFRARGGLQMMRCIECSSCRLDRSNGGGPDGTSYDVTYFYPWNLTPGSPEWRLREATAAIRLRTLKSLGAEGGALLDIGAAGGYLVHRASREGFDARGIEISHHAVAVAGQVVPGKVCQGSLETVRVAKESLDVVTLFDVLEHLTEPRKALERVASWLKPRGWVAVTTPDVDSLSARLMAGAWPHYKEEHLFYPSRRGLRMLIESAGFETKLDVPATKCLSVGFTAPLLRRYPVPLLTPTMSLFYRFMPRSLRDASFRVSIGERLQVGRKR